MVAKEREALAYKVRRCDLVWVVVLALIAAAAFSFGSSLAATGFYTLDGGTLAFAFLIAFVIFALLYLLLPKALAYVRVKIGHQVRIPIPAFTLRSICLYSLIVFAIWSFVLVSMYPGSMNWDTYYQISQCYPGQYPVWIIPYAPTGSITDAWFSDHHPLLDTLLYGLFARASDAATGSWNLGVFLFVAIQSYLTAVGLVASVAYLERLGTPKVVQFVSLIICCLFPVFPLYGATMLKDSLFSMLFIPYMLVTCELVRTKGVLIKENRRLSLIYLGLSILLCLTKKPGMYVVIITTVVYLVAYKESRLVLAVQLAAIVLVMNVLLPLVVFPALHVIPGGKQEALGPVFQQTARYVVEHPSEVTEDERAAIDKVLGYDDLAARYDPFSNDLVKFGYKYDSATSDDTSRYIRVWAVQGLKHPETYFTATWCTAAQYLNLDASIAAYTYTGDAAHGGSDKLAQPTLLKPLHDAVVGAYEWVRNAPILEVLFRIGLYAYILPSVAFACLLRARSDLTPAFIPVALSLLVCVVTPVVNARYALPLIYLAPLFIGMLFSAQSCQKAKVGLHYSKSDGRKSLNKEWVVG